MTCPTASKFALATLAFILSLSIAHAQTAEPPGVTEHTAVATKVAKADLLGALGLCKTATPEPAPAFMDTYRRCWRSRRWSRCR